MPPHSPISIRRAFALMGITVLLAYGNTFDCSWHLDDFDRIVQNKSVQLSQLSPHGLSAFFKDVWMDGFLQRPLAFTSLAANWYAGADNPWGYHVFNIAIHLLAGFFLYRVFTWLFQTPRLAGAYTREQAGFVSLLAALLWTLNPIQTQAVTYVIQRMASMCSMFFILAVYFYLNGRMTAVWLKKILYFVYCLLGFAAAFLSKENAATLPLALLLVEAVFFQDLARRGTRRLFLSVSLAMVAAGLVCGAVFFFGGDVFGVLTYGDRPFTPWERLLSQPRALMLYLSLIFYPAPTRLSITHDFEVSAALFQPWTTLPSLAAMVGLIALALWRIRRWPLVSFAILFFFLNHAIESGIIGLELVFEHRNHLPSMFLFLPVAAGIAHVRDHFRHRSSVVSLGLWVFVPLLLVGFATGTYVRNQAWESEKSLWQDALAKAPGESRPYHMLAGHHYDRVGDFDMSMRLYNLSLTRRMSRLSHEALIYNNMAALHYGRKDFEAAAELWKKALEVFPEYRLGRYHLSITLIRLGRLDEALGHIEEILKHRPDYFGPRNLQGIILIRQEKHSEALASFRRCLKSGGLNRAVMINLGAAFYYLGDYAKAALFFKETLKMAPQDRTTLAWLAQTCLRSGSTPSADDPILRLLSTGSAADLRAWFDSCNTYWFVEDDVVPPDVDAIFLDRLRTLWIQAAGISIDRPAVDALQPGPIE